MGNLFHLEKAAEPTEKGTNYYFSSRFSFNFLSVLPALPFSLYVLCRNLNAAENKTKTQIH